MNKTSIEWCRTYQPDGTYAEGHSVNPVRFRPRGSTRLTTMCQKVSPGCAICYAESITRRWWPKEGAGEFPGYTALGVVSGDFVLDEKMLVKVLRFKKPTKIFWGDMTDLFQESVPDEFLDCIFAVCALTPHITHMFLTKRPERMREYLNDRTRDIEQGVFTSKIGVAMARISTTNGDPAPGNAVLELCSDVGGWPLPNVWLGTSVENQPMAVKRIPHLLATPAAVRYLSLEPLLEEVDLTRVDWVEEMKRDLKEKLEAVKGDSFEETLASMLAAVEACKWEEGRAWRNVLTGAWYDGWDGDDNPEPAHPTIDLAIVGGESGQRARPMNPDNVRVIRDHCVSANVAFNFKQWGAWAPSEAIDTVPSVQDRDNPSRRHVFKNPAKPRCAQEEVWFVGKGGSIDFIDGKQWHQFPEKKQ